MKIKHKHELVAQFGHQCSRCGYSRSLRALQFHHVDSSEKDLWSKYGGVNHEEIRKHPERFLLLCANCHFEEHERIDESNRLYVACRHCGKKFPTKPALLANDRGLYCSKRCQHDHRVIEASQQDSIEKRFLKKTCQEGECLIWIGYKYAGCGMMMITKDDGRHAPRTARTIANFLSSGEWIKGTQPTCGNSDCVNVKHLKLPTKLTK